VKILEQSPQKLVLRSRPSPVLVAFIIVWASGFAGIPLFLMPLVAESAGVETVTCQRQQTVNCLITRTTYFGLAKREPQTIEHIESAGVDRAMRRDGGRRTRYVYQVFVQTTQGKVPLTPFQNHSQVWQDVAAQINQLKSGARTVPLVATIDHRLENLGTLLLLSLFVGIGVTILWAILQVRTYMFERLFRRLTVHRSTLFGKSTRQYSFQDIEQVTLEEVRRKARRFHNLLLTLKTGKKLMLDSETTPGNLSAIADLVRKILA
jgi:hypothetical protein